MTTKVDGGELVARTLRAFGVDCAFVLHGGHLDSLLIGLQRNGIRLLDTRHEAVSVDAADGYARATGRLGVAFVTAASGYSNALAGIAVAYADRSPVLILTSSPPLRDAEMNALQGTVDQVAMAAPITKWAHRVTVVEEIPRLVSLAVRKAMSGAPGPVVLDLPIDILFAPADESKVAWGAARSWLHRRRLLPQRRLRRSPCSARRSAPSSSLAPEPVTREGCWSSSRSAAGSRSSASCTRSARFPPTIRSTASGLATSGC